MKPFKIKKILVTSDFSNTSLKAMDYAILMAKLAKADITLLHVIEDLSATAFLGGRFTTRAQIIKKELARLAPILTKLGSEYAAALHRSFTTYSEHVSKAHNSVIESFIIPFYIKGLTI